MPVVQWPGQTASAPQAESKLHGLVREAGAALGCTFSFPVVPRPRLHLMLLNGQADVMLPAARDPERDAVGAFVPMLQMPTELVMRRKDPRRPVDFAALVADDGLHGLMVRGQAWGGVLDQALQVRAASRVQRVSDAASMLRMLAAGRADFTIISGDIFRSLASRDDLRDAASKLESRPLLGLPMVEAGAYVSHSLNAADRSLVQRVLSTPAVLALMHSAQASGGASGPR